MHTVVASTPSVTAVWAVAGEVECLGTSGTSAQSHFTCRTFMFDGRSLRTTVDIADPNDAGQQVIRR